MRKLLWLALLLAPLAARAQSQVPHVSCSLSTTQTCTIGNANGAYGASFEEIPSGSPASVSVTIQGCATGGTCDSAADTNTSTSATIRGVTFTKVYDYFLVTATLSGGTTPKITVNALISTANSHTGGSGGGGCIATVSTLTASCGGVDGRLATVTDGSTSSDCSTGGGGNVVACIYNGSAWVFAGNSGSAPTYAQVTTGTNTGQAFTTGTGGTLNSSGTATVDFSTLGTFKIPSSAGFAATATKMLGFDSTASKIHGWNGADSIWPATLANSSHKWLNSYTQSTGAFTQTQPASTDLSDNGSVVATALFGAAGAATTLNGVVCTLASTCTLAFSTGASPVNNASLNGLNLAPGTGIGLTVTPTNTGTNVVTFPLTGTVTIVGGGTGQTTANAGFNALSPLTTEGDVVYYHSSAGTRLGIGSNGSCLTSNGTDPLWGSCATGSIGGTGTANTLAKFTASSTIGNSDVTDNGTVIGLGIPAQFTQVAAPTGSAGSSWLWADSTADRLQMKNNNNTAVNVVASGADINTSDQVVSTHLTSALPNNQGGTGTGSALTGLVRGGTPFSAGELTADATTSGSNAVTVVALRGASLPTLSGSTGLLYDTAGTLSLPGTLPTAAEPAHTGDATNTAGSLAMTVVALRNATLPTLAASTGLLFDTAGTLSLPATLPTSAVPAFTGDMTSSSGSLATTVSKINGTAFSGTNGHIVSFGASNTPADSGLVASDEINYHTPATGIARTTTSSQVLASSELSGDATTSGSNVVTVVNINGNSVPSGAANHQTLIATGTSTTAWKTVTDCNGGSNALNFTQSTNAFSCLSIATLSNPMTTLGDMIYGGAAGAVSRLAGPTSGNSAYGLTSLPSGGSATTPAWAVAGIGVDSESGATFTIQSDAQTTPDRGKIVLTTNGTTSTAVTVPQAGSSSMLGNYPFVHMNTGSVVATDTPTTSTVDGNAALKLVGCVSGHNCEAAFWWSDAVSGTGNWWAAEILPTDANGRLGAEGFGALTGDVTNSAGSYATTVSKINNTSFAGTNGDLVSFGAANVPADSGVVAANVVTAASNFTNADLVQAAGANKTTSDSGIATANVVTAASNYASGGLIYAAAANKTTTNSADFAVSSHTLSGGANGIFDMHALTGANAFQVESVAGLTSNGTSSIGYDATAKLFHLPTNGADSTAVVETGTSTTTTQVLHATAVAGVGAFSAIATGDLPTGIPIANVGSAGLSGVLPISISSAGAISEALFVTNAQTATYQVLAADFASCKTIPVASGTFTVTLVASGSQPASGQCIWVINYGTGVVTLARSGQNINGGTTSLTVPAGSATAPTGAWVVSDGTNYEATLFGAGGGGGGVTSFSGDGTFITNSSSTGAVTATLGTAGAHTWWGNNTGSTAAPGYQSLTAADLPSIPINKVISATGAITAIALGNNPLSFTCALTSGASCVNATEATASTTSGAGNILSSTLTTSTANPLQLTMGANGPAAANAPLVINVTAAAAGGLASGTSAGFVGAGYTFPTGTGSAGSTTGAGGAGGAFTVTEGNGGAGAGAASNGGAGGGLAWTLGTGGTAGTTTGVGGIGGGYTITGGTGGTSTSTTGTGGIGTTISFTAGTGGADTASGGVGGVGGAFNLTTGNGGASGGTGTNPAGGNITLTLGKAGVGGTGSVGAGGELIVQGTAIASLSSASNSPNAGTMFAVSGLTGGANSNASGTAGSGSAISLTTGTGGAGTGTNSVGGTGGTFTVTAGGGGASLGTGVNANGGNIVLTPGAAGTGGSGTAGLAGVVSVGGQGAGFVYLTQGTAITSSNTNVPANSIIDEAPTAVTAYTNTRPGTAAQGIAVGTLSGSVITQGYSGDSNHSATVSWSTATSVGSTSLCSTTFCPAGTYRISGYIDVTTACTTTGSYVVNLIYTDDTTVSKTVVIPFQGLGFTTTFGPSAVSSTLVPVSTTDYGAIVPFTIRSTGGASINYSTTAGACGTGGPGVGKLYLIAEPIQ
jgi:hypothetical protein